MGRIRVLDDAMINRIAAGEVVERPASVVKELVENSLDAGASEIRIVLEGGGKRKIRVEDDGSGMDRDDSLLSIERHATSKLDRREGLDGIRSYGFRGEALPSIAAVSRFVLRTAAEEGEGIEIEIRGGRLGNVREAPAPKGTCVEVSGLFFNVPARRKFLRTDSTELQHVVRAVGAAALAQPRVRFELIHEGRSVLSLEPVPDTMARAPDVIGADASETMIPIDFEKAGMRVRGLVGRPVDASPRRDRSRIFVNGRPVLDRLLGHAIAAAYGNTVPRGQTPRVLLLVDLEPRLVDVNVHPQKAEVRFARPREVHDAVREAIAGSLSREAAVPVLGDLLPSWSGEEWAPSNVDADRVATSSPESPVVAVAEPAPGAHRQRLQEGPRVQVLAQHRDSYIVAADERGLILVDQHVAHERVLFESYLRDAEADRVAVQNLLFPIIVDLPTEESLMVETEAAELTRLGFRVEPFGGHSVRIDAVPAIAAGVDPATLFRELLEDARRLPSARAGSETLRARWVTTAACQAAIKIHHPLNHQAMQALLDDLFRTSNPTTCPHGRPIVFRLDDEAIERAFRRR